MPTAKKPVVVDKNRAWLHCIELLLDLDPDAKLLVPIRELGQLYGSIESQHQKTILLDFIDHLADYDRFGRADQLFAKDKAIGAPLSSLQAVQDLPQTVKDRLFFVKFEDLMRSRWKPCPRFMPGWAWHRISSIHSSSRCTRMKATATIITSTGMHSTRTSKVPRDMKFRHAYSN